MHREVPPSASPAAATRPLEQALAQARMALQVSEARSHELEREIDSLNQRLRQGQEELAFFRKARDPNKASR
jgi:multidrug resistance efflux pump